MGGEYDMWTVVLLAVVCVGFFYGLYRTYKNYDGGDESGSGCGGCCGGCSGCSMFQSCSPASKESK